MAHPRARPSFWAAALWTLELAWSALVISLPVLAWVTAGRSWWITALVTFDIYLYAPLALALLASLWQRRILVHLPAWVALGVFLWHYGGQLLPTVAAPQGETLRVMTYNVSRYQREEAGVVAAVRRSAPDILALQEVADVGHRDNLLPRLEALGLHCEHRPYYEGSRGVGVALCVTPEVTLRNVQRRTYHAGGRWSYLFGEAKWQGRMLNLVAPHLLAFRISTVDPLREARTVVARVRDASRWHRQEGRALLALIEELEDPTLLLGDFNSTPYQALHVEFRRHLRDAFRESGFGFGATYRYYLPVRIDYIYGTRELAMYRARVGGAGPSDHRPVIAEVAFEAIGEP